MWRHIFKHTHIHNIQSKKFPLFATVIPCFKQISLYIKGLSDYLSIHLTDQLTGWYI